MNSTGKITKEKARERAREISDQVEKECQPDLDAQTVQIREAEAALEQARANVTEKELELRRLQSILEFTLDQKQFKKFDRLCDSFVSE